MKILLIDNFDSFTFNLVHLLSETLECQTEVISYSDFIIDCLNGFDAMVISPGPGKPREYQKYGILKEYDLPILGICLGMQVLNELYGGRTDILDYCIHGQTDEIQMSGQQFSVARYHSLYIQKVADDFDIIAQNKQGIPMAIKHKRKPLIGYQFHPESFMTKEGQFFINYAFDSIKEFII